MKVKVINNSGFNLPSYATVGSAGLDLRASLIVQSDTPHHFDTYDSILKPKETLLIRTGISFEIPDGYEAQIRPRSGLALKYGVTVLNSPGTIDSDYRGEIRVILINHGSEAFRIKHGDRIAQIVFAKFEQAELTLVEEISQTQRNKGGFGSTGN
jgi:dUTP pyrophosphatase